jgi:hypothetical protein
MFVGCNPQPQPPPIGRDVPVDVALEDVVLPGIDRPDVRVDAPSDLPRDRTLLDVTDAGNIVDLPRVDVPPGSAWCDLPVTPDTEVRGITLPAGFCMRRYARAAHPRVLAFSPTGDLFFASPSNHAPGGTGPGLGAIAILPDDNRDGVADSIVRYAEVSSGSSPGFVEMGSVHGLLFHNASLYFTTHNGVWRVPFRPGDRRVPTGTMAEQIADLSNSERWTHTLAVGTDGTMYVSKGIYGSTMCPLGQPDRGAILAIGGGRARTGEIVARGFRNPMYIRCQPWGSCYAAELTDDTWSAPGREKIIRFQAGQDFGYPCCYERSLPSPANGGRVSCDGVTASLVGFPVGDTPFGHDFAPLAWPGIYSGALFIGLHGQVHSWRNTGINVARTNPMTHEFMGETAQQFLGGWGMGTPNQGRIADLVFAPDGRMFVTDDEQDEVYWIAPTSLRMPVR